MLEWGRGWLTGLRTTGHQRVYAQGQGTQTHESWGRPPGGLVGMIHQSQRAGWTQPL
jgi:hypothetical protein